VSRGAEFQREKTAPSPPHLDTLRMPQVLHGGCTREDTRARLPRLNNADCAALGSHMCERNEMDEKVDYGRCWSALSRTFLRTDLTYSWTRGAAKPSSRAIVSIPAHSPKRRNTLASMVENRQTSGSGNLMSVAVILCRSRAPTIP
jgi:hypothetical protein